MRQRAQHNHIFGARVAGGLGEIGEWHAETAVKVVGLEFAGVVDDDAAVADFVSVIQVRLFVEAHQHVEFVAGAQDMRG